MKCFSCYLFPVTPKIKNTTTRAVSIANKDDLIRDLTTGIGSTVRVLKIFLANGIKWVSAVSIVPLVPYPIFHVHTFFITAIIVRLFGNPINEFLFSEWVTFRSPIGTRVVWSTPKSRRPLLQCRLKMSKATCLTINDREM